MSTARLLTLILVLFLGMLVPPAPVLAETTSDLNLPGIGNLIPVESFLINPADLIVTRQVDSFTPALFNAVATGTVFATGSLDTFDTSFSTTTPITSFIMSDIENPIETLTLVS